MLLRAFEKQGEVGLTFLYSSRILVSSAFSAETLTFFSFLEKVGWEKFALGGHTLT